MPRRIEMVSNLVLSIAPGTPRWHGRSTPARRRFFSQPPMVLALKHIWVAM